MEKIVALIVEDEALVRLSAAQAVEDGGFSVVEACNAEEAITILEDRNDIGVLFTDIDMSGSLNGIELAYIVHLRWPWIHLIVTSGPNVPERGQLPPSARFIPKPYRTEHLIAALRDLTYPNPIFARVIATSAQRISTSHGIGRFRS